METPEDKDTLLCLFPITPTSQLRLSEVRSDGPRLVDLRVWQLEGNRWVPGDGMKLPLDELPHLWQALTTATGILLAEARPRVVKGSSDHRRLQRAQEVERARERLAATRPEHYRRLSDYRRVRTLRLLELRRAERLLQTTDGTPPTDPEP